MPQSRALLGRRLGALDASPYFRREALRRPGLRWLRAWRRRLRRATRLAVPPDDRVCLPWRRRGGRGGQAAARVRGLPADVEQSVGPQTARPALERRDGVTLRQRRRRMDDADLPVRAVRVLGSDDRDEVR